MQRTRARTWLGPIQASGACVQVMRQEQQVPSQRSRDSIALLSHKTDSAAPRCCCFLPWHRRPGQSPPGPVLSLCIARPAPCCLLRAACLPVRSRSSLPRHDDNHNSIGERAGDCAKAVQARGLVQKRLRIWYLVISQQLRRTQTRSSQSNKVLVISLSFIGEKKVGVRDHDRMAP